MAVNEAKYRIFRDAGFSHQAALVLSDDTNDQFGGHFGSSSEESPAGPVTVYNVSDATLRRSRADLAKALNGTGVLSGLILGDSLAIGTDGAVTLHSASLARCIAQGIAAERGLPIVGSGIMPVSVANQVWWSDVITATNGVNYNDGIASMFASGAFTWVSPVAGTSVQIEWIDAPGFSAPFTYAIDGGSAVTVNPTGSNAHELVTVNGLSNTAHTVVISAPGDYAFFAGLRCFTPNAAGVEVHSGAYGGSVASLDVPGISWTGNTGSSISLNRVRRDMFNEFAINPSFLGVSLGTNDMWRNKTVAETADGIEEIRSWYPNSDFFLLGAHSVPGTDPTLWEQFKAERYALADRLGCPLFDFSVRMGPYADAVARGLFGADLTHPIHGVTRDWGRVIARAMEA